MRVVFIAVLLAALAAGCNDRPLAERMVDEVAAPPSVSAELDGAAHVRLTAEQAADLSVRTVVVRYVNESFETVLPGTVLPSPEHFAQVSAPIAGRVAHIYAHEGEAVRRGQALLALESLEFASLAADFVQARAEADYQALQVERLQTLVDQKIAPRSRLDRATADLTRAEANVRATTARLRTLGIDDELMESWAVGDADRPVLLVRAPITGTIDRHLIDLGQSVSAYQEMLSIVNPAAVLIRGYLTPADAPSVKTGSDVCIEAPDMPDCVIDAKVTTVNPSVDPENRAVTVNVITPTVDGWPRPGQTVRLTIQAGSTRRMVPLPLSAIQYTGDTPTVFVRIDSLTYESRSVEIGRVAEDMVVVSSGLVEGEEVAVSQIFSLKALSRFEQYAEE